MRWRRHTHHTKAAFLPERFSSGGLFAAAMLWMLCDLREKLVGVYGYGFCDINKFNHIQPPFAPLQLRNKRPRARKALGQDPLIEALPDAVLLKQRRKLWIVYV